VAPGCGTAARACPAAAPAWRGIRGPVPGRRPHKARGRPRPRRSRPLATAPRHRAVPRASGTRPDSASPRRGSATPRCNRTARATRRRKSACHRRPPVPVASGRGRKPGPARRRSRGRNRRRWRWCAALPNGRCRSPHARSPACAGRTPSETAPPAVHALCLDAFEGLARAVLNQRFHQSHRGHHGQREHQQQARAEGHGRPPSSHRFSNRHSPRGETPGPPFTFGPTP